MACFIEERTMVKKSGPVIFPPLILREKTPNGRLLNMRQRGPNTGEMTIMRESYHKRCAQSRGRIGDVAAEFLTGN